MLTLQQGKLIFILEVKNRGAVHKDIFGAREQSPPSTVIINILEALVNYHLVQRQQLALQIVVIIYQIIIITLMSRNKGDTCDKQQVISTLKGNGLYVDQRIQDGYFISQVQSKDKMSMNVNHMYLMEDVLINSMVPDGTIVYNQLCNYSEYRNALPATYNDRQTKYHMLNLVNSCTQQGFELALWDVQITCDDLAKDLAQSNVSEVIFRGEDICEELQNKADMYSKIHHKKVNGYKPLKYEKEQMSQHAAKRVKGHASTGEIVQTKKNHNRIDFSGTSAQAIQDKLARLESGDCSDDDKQKLIRDLYQPMRFHSIHKQLSDCRVRVTHGSQFLMRITYDIFHDVKHQCIGTEKAAQAVAGLTDPQVQYYYSHNMSARIHRQTRSYNFVMQDPAKVNRKIPVRQYVRSQRLLFEVKHLTWQRCDKVFEACQKAAYVPGQADRFDYLASQKANTFQNRHALEKMCIYCFDVYNGVSLYWMSCEHCVCQSCATSLSVKACYKCKDKVIEVKSHFQQASEPIHSSADVKAPEGSQEEMIAELRLYQQYFENTVKETFESLSQSAYAHIMESGEAARQALLEKDQQMTDVLKRAQYNIVAHQKELADRDAIHAVAIERAAKVDQYYEYALLKEQEAEKMQQLYQQLLAQTQQQNDVQQLQAQFSANQITQQQVNPEDAENPESQKQDKSSKWIPQSRDECRTKADLVAWKKSKASQSNLQEEFKQSNIYVEQEGNPHAGRYQQAYSELNAEGDRSSDQMVVDQHNEQEEEYQDASEDF